jgi:hypothetical protein
MINSPLSLRAEVEVFVTRSLYRAELENQSSPKHPPRKSLKENQHGSGQASRWGTKRERAIATAPLPRLAPRSVHFLPTEIIRLTMGNVPKPCASSRSPRGQRTHGLASVSTLRIDVGTELDRRRRTRLPR